MFRTVRSLWHFLFMFVIVFSFASPASAQDAKVKIDTDGAVPMVEVWHPSFEAMCRTLSQKLGAEGNEKIRLQPKVLPPSRERYLGDIWTAGANGKMIEISSVELPLLLRNIRGAAAKAVYIGSCMLKDNYFFSTEHVVFTTSSLAEAQVLAAAIR